MTGTLERIRGLARASRIMVSDHGYDELASDGLLARDVVDGLPDADLVEDYPNYHKGPCVLVLQRMPDGSMLHVVWGIPAGQEGPAVLVTAYRPDPNRWTEDFKRRKPG